MGFATILPEFVIKCASEEFNFMLIQIEENYQQEKNSSLDLHATIWAIIIMVVFEFKSYPN